MEQLGPFHIFFTLSCAEMRWPSVLSEVFRTIGNGKIKIHYDDDWDGSAEKITVTQVNENGDLEEINGEYTPTLSTYQKWYFEQKKISMTDFLKDHFVLITRIFDKRVNDFITEVMKKKGIINYSYRVEFQMRGLPHIHGVAWLNKDLIKDCVDDNGLFREDKAGEEHLIKLIDQWISCKLEFGHADQNEDIKVRKSKIQHAEKNQESLLAEINQINKDIQDLKNEKALLTEELTELAEDEHYMQLLNLEILKAQMKELQNEKKAKVKVYNNIKDNVKPELVEELRKRELNQLVKEVNMHHHTNSCGKYRKDKCRYNFPRLFSDKTIIANPLQSNKKDDDDVVKNILEKRSLILKLVKEGYKQLDEDETKFDDCPKKFLEEKCGLNVKEHGFSTDDPDNILNIKNPNDIMEIYNKALSISDKGRDVILKRKISERNVNNFNPLFQSVWQANTDIQLVLDQHAVISYISDYMTKSDQGLTKHLKAALNEKKNCSVFEQLNHVKRTYFTHKQTCVSEATYRLLPGLDLKGSNIKTLFLCSGFPENRRTYLRQIPEDERQDDGIQIEGREGRFQQPISRIEYYNARPKDSTSKYSVGRLENMCFAEFCMKYDKVSKKSISENKWKFEEFKNEEGEVVHGIGYEANSKKAQKIPLDGLPQYFFFVYEGKQIYMKLRANPYVLRIYSGKRKDNIEETYSELLLFTSWRDERTTFYNDDPHFREKIRIMFQTEDEKKSEDNNQSEEFKDVKRRGSEVERNRKKIYPYSERIKELRALLEEGDFRTSNLGLYTHTSMY